MPTVSESAITNLNNGIRHRFQVWRAVGNLSVEDEGLIVGSWVPTGPNWSDVTSLIDMRSQITIKANNTITFRVRSLDRSAWPDDRAVAIVAQHWDGSAFCPWYVVGWGFIRGNGNQEIERFNQFGEVTLSYIERFAMYPTRPVRFGSRDIAVSGSIAGESTVLASPAVESPLEYISQADVSGVSLIDGKVNTVAIADVIADPARPVMGESQVPRILRFGAHRTTRGIGDGGEPIWIEVWVGWNAIPWGTTWVGVPDMYNTSSGEGLPAIRDDAHVQTTIQDYGTYKAFRAVLKQDANFNAEGWLQWILGGSPGLPFRVELEMRAIDAYTASQPLLLTVTTSDPAGSSRQQIDALRLSTSWQFYGFDFDDSGNYGGAKLSIKAFKGSLQASAMTYEIRNFKILFGFDSAVYSSTEALYLALDDGAGHERWLRVAWNLEKSGRVRIPPYKTLIFTDDIATFKNRYDPGDSQIYQIRDQFPEFFFGPNVGRVRLVYGGNPPNLNDIDTFPGSYTMLDQIDFVTRPDLVWQPSEGMVRLSPMGTGDLVVEPFPRPGMDQQFGSAFWWVDLGAYVPATLDRDIPIGTKYIPVSDPSKYAISGSVRIGAENITYTSKDGEYLYAPAGTTAAHSQNDAVIPRLDGNANTGTNNRTGPLVARVMLRRKVGTPYPESGVVLYSNLASPRDPSDALNVVGSKWENHPDWEKLGRFAGNTSDVIDMVPPLAPVPGGSANVIQARHWCVVIDRMRRYNNVAQRAKLNEFIIMEYNPDSGTSGAYTGTGATDYTGAVGHILVTYANLPANKYIPIMGQTPLGDVSIPASTVQAALASLLSNQYLAAYNDPMNNIYMGGVPGSHLYNPGGVTWTWTPANIKGRRMSGAWDEGHKVSKVTVWAIEPATFRHYTFQYPEVGYVLGKAIEVKDAYITSRDQGRNMARAIFLISNARGKMGIIADAAPWVRLYQRHVVNIPGLDAGGAWDGLSMYVSDYTITIGMNERGRVEWNTSIQLAELPQ